MNIKLIIFFCLLTVAHTHFGKRVIGGSIALPYSFPNIVAVFDIRITLDALFCGGTIYNPSWIVVTGVCASKIGPVCPMEYVRVAAGKWNLTASEPYQQIRSVVFVRVHDAFVAFNAGTSIDLGVIKLNQSLVFNIYLRAFPFSTVLTYPQGPGIVVGWGASTLEQIRYKVTADILHILDVYVIQFEDCKLAISSAMQVNDQQHSEPSLDIYHLCTGSLGNDIHGPAYGDNGGPLLQRTEEGNYEVVGIISAAVKNPYLGLYIHVPHFTSWINTTIEYFSWI